MVDENFAGRPIMPFYVVCDVSGSMHADMADLNAALNTLITAISAEPVVSDVAQLSIISFSDRARIHAPLNEPSRIAWSALATEGGTNYGAAFKAIHDSIETDLTHLRARKYDTFRPAVFFLTDGAPLDGDWFETFTSTLTYDRNTGAGMKRHPIFIPFGFRDAPEHVLAKLAYPPERGKYYLAKDTSIADALKGILSIIMTSVMNSAKSIRAVSASPADPATSGATGSVVLPNAGASGIVRGDSTYDLDKTD